MNRQLPLLLAAGLGIFSTSPSVPAQTRDSSGYLVDQRDVVVRSGTQLCWHTGYWTPAMAILECDPDLVKKPEAPPAAASPPPPAPPPPPTAKPAVEKLTLAADALFDFDKATLRADGRTRLDQLVEESRNIRLEVIVVIGHSDRIGSEQYNQKLSERRAEAVKAHLVERGIDANRVHAEGKGEKEPVTGNQCLKLGKESGRNRKLVDCLQPDRRVVIEIVGTR